MGEFAKSVRYGKTPGPTQKRFNRTEWDSQISNSTLDAEDKRVLYAGLPYSHMHTFSSPPKNRGRMDASRGLRSRAQRPRV